MMKSALIIIDVQAGLFPEDDLPSEALEVIDRINRVSNWARCMPIPVIWVQHETQDGELTCGSDGWELQNDLTVLDSDILIRKTTSDSFLRTNLETTLHSLRVDHLYVCGYSSEFCVDTTVRRGAGLGFPVTLISDAHTSHDKAHLSGSEIRDHENATLPNITSFGVPITVKATKEILSSSPAC